MTTTLAGTQFRAYLASLPPEDRDWVLHVTGHHGPARRPPSAVSFDSREHADPVLIQFYLDGKIGDRYVEQWRPHTATCHQCASLYEAYGLRP